MNESMWKMLESRSDFPFCRCSMTTCLCRLLCEKTLWTIVRQSKYTLQQLLLTQNKVTNDPKLGVLLIFLSRPSFPLLYSKKDMLSGLANFHIFSWILEGIKSVLKATHVFFLPDVLLSISSKLPKKIPQKSSVWNS